MEAIGATASLLGVVGFTLTSLRAIHEIVSTIRDGPGAVSEIADGIAQLRTMLERVDALAVVPTSGTGLIDIIDRCWTDIAALETKLRPLLLLPDERRSGKLWKKVKALISEKELIQIRQAIHVHISTINLHLTIWQTASVSGSSTQLTEIMGILNQLKNDVASLAAPTPALPLERSFTVAATQGLIADTTPGPSPLGCVLDESIARLVGLMDTSEQTVDSEDAAQLMDDLQQLLELAQKASDPPVLAKESGSSAGQGHSGDNVKRELKLMGNLILSSPLVEINKLGPTSLASLASPGTIVRQARKRKSLHLEGGSMTVQSNTLRRKILDARGSQSQRENDKGDREFIANIMFRPAGRQSMITLTVHQRQIARGAASGIPRLCINNIIPSTSEVFRLATEGKLDEIVALISRGEASLRDHDEDGWSLLHYASRNLHLPLCKFLVESGLDVDEIAEDRARANFAVNPLQLAAQADESFATSPYPLAVSTVLLEHGADPTAELPGYGWLPDFLVTGTHPYQKSVLDATLRLARYFIDPGIRSSTNGRTTFLTACSATRRYYADDPLTSAREHVETLSLLLRNGSSIDDRDDRGFNCLHVLFGDWCKRPFEENRQLALIFLVSQGADVRARDNRGLSVSDLAYRKSCVEAPGLGSYRGDLWDSVLAACGYDIREFRSAGRYVRRGSYTDWYTRQDFERLWEGREDRCPYWDDSPWPPDIPRTSERLGAKVVHNCRGVWCTSHSRLAAMEEEEDDAVMEDDEMESDDTLGDEEMGETGHEVEIEIAATYRRMDGAALQAELEGNPWSDPGEGYRRVMETHNDEQPRHEH